MTLMDRPAGAVASDRRRGGDHRRRPQKQEHWHEQRPRANVGNAERVVSITAGSILAIEGLRRQSVPGLLIATVGGGLIYRGATGHCPAYQALNMNTAEPQGLPREYFERGIHVVQSCLINKSPEELYVYWRKLENLPRIMTHLESVVPIDDRRSHWVATAPSIAGGKVEWDAEIINDEPNALIAWRSLPGADVDNAGSLRFIRTKGDRGTMVVVTLDYVPPAGRVGKWIASLFGEEPAQQIQEDLRNFKRVMETGEIPTTQGQPRGTCKGAGERQRGW